METTHEHEDICSLTIGKLSTEFVMIKVLNYEYPQVSDGWDSNWLTTQIELKAGAFSGNFSAHLQTVNFQDFKIGLERLYKDLKGTTKFSSIEDWIDIKLIGDGLGHFEVEGSASDFPGTGNQLSFHLLIDQTEIPELLKQLTDILNQFPVRGKVS